jgi:hypothetical protein
MKFLSVFDGAGLQEIAYLFYPKSWGNFHPELLISWGGIIDIRARSCGEIDR